MKVELERVAPMEIEARSFEIIEGELPHPIDPATAPIVKRVIHATADFDYADALWFSDGALDAAQAALREGAVIVTDTAMAMAGINKRALSGLGGEVRCFIADADVAEEAAQRGVTRASAAVDKAAGIDRPLILAIGNAPTALIRACELIAEGRLRPRLVIGVPVGFVNVVPSKELLMATDVPSIVARGRKGGSTVAVAICNALMYGIGERAMPGPRITR